MQILTVHRLPAVRVLCVAALALCLSPAGHATAAAGEAVQAYQGDGSSIAVRPLDDPANPYRGQYSALERWVVQHAESFEHWHERALAEQQQISAEAVAKGLQGPVAGPDTTLFVFVDSNGWVKAEQAQPSYRDPWREPGTPHDVLNRTRALPAAPAVQTLSYFIPAPLADLPAELKAYKQETRERWKAASLPPIPAWLGSRPPLRAIFMPNGDVVTYGPLNLHYAPRLPEQADDWRPLDVPAGEIWYRYSAAGRLLGQHGPEHVYGNPWFSLYWPQLEQTLAAFPRAGRELDVTYSGYWVALTDPMRLEPPDFKLPDIQVYAAWSYSGQPLDLASNVPDEIGGLMRQAEQRTLAEVYALQVKYGLTDQQAVSPYAGQPDGPLAVDPAPRPWPAMASGVRGGPDYVRMLDPQAEANPYRGTYTSWDAWVWQQRNAVKPGPRKVWSGNDPSGFKGEPLDFYDTWRELWLPVDDNGALPPLAQAGLIEARARLERDHRQVGGDWRNWKYNTVAQGELDAGQWTALLGEKLRLALPLYPAVPEWLEAQPAVEVIFVPNGDIVTYGPRGSFDMSPGVAPDERNRAGRAAALYVYAPDGQPKGTVEAGQSWVSFYRAPALNAQLDAARAAGRTVEENDGITLVFAGPLYAQDEKRHWHSVVPPPALLEAYAWDGTPLDISQPLTLPDYHGVMLPWHEVQWVHDVRALRGE
jgi:hypothetical protein